MSNMQQWEYQLATIQNSTDNNAEIVYPEKRRLPKWEDYNSWLNQMGKLGWELTGVGVSSYQGSHVFLQLYFKRPKIS